jgi:hypothetical protein
MTPQIGRHFATFAILALAAVAAVKPGESRAGGCPYDGDYIACLEAGEGVTYCKRYVLNCPDTSGPMGEDPAPCDWLIDETLGKKDCSPFSSGYVRVGFPLDITSNGGDCPYDSYVDCLLSTEHYQDSPWCKQHQLNCHAVETATVVVPIEAACGPFSIDGTIEYEGTPEIIGNMYCLHVTSYDYTGGQKSTVNAQIDAILAQKNPDCGGDTNCVCMPASCL